MKKVLVTGAGGYIGRHVVNELIAQGVDVTAIDLRTEGIDQQAKTVQYDIFNGNPDIFRELGSPDVCLHMAWKDGFVHNSDAHMDLLSNHYKFIKDMVNGGLKHIAIMGTMHEVGYYEGAIDENTICNPINMYGIAKDALRRCVFLMLKDKDIVLQWLRAFYIYGDDEYNNSIFSKLTIAGKEGKKTFPFTTGKNKYDFIHVDELAKQITASILQNKINGIINCCKGIPLSLAEKIESYIEEHGFDIRLEYGMYPDRPYDSPGIWGDSGKIEQIISSKLD